MVSGKQKQGGGGGGGRLESILHSELFIHQQNLQSFEEGRDVQAFHLEMFALHCTACSTLFCIYACVPGCRIGSVSQTKRVGLVEHPKLPDIP